jgi:hypothetical protein
MCLHPLIQICARSREVVVDHLLKENQLIDFVPCKHV